MAKKSKRQSDYERGYECGKLAVISRLDSEIARLEESNAKKALSKIKDWMWKNYEEYVPNFGYTEPSKYEMKFCYVTTFNYRNKSVDVFDDDNGQQYYFYYDGKEYSCGAYNFDYESCITYVIDHDLDDICNFGLTDDRFFGGYCRYANHEHTKVEFSFRGEVISVYDVDESDPNSVEKICKRCEDMLSKLFQDPEFLEMERKRKESGNLYFSELIEAEENKLKEESSK